MTKNEKNPKLNLDLKKQDLRHILNDTPQILIDEILTSHLLHHEYLLPHDRHFFMNDDLILENQA